MADITQTPQPRKASASRARRIGDSEWEAFRPEIEKLYLDQGNSRKAVIEKLAQDGFLVTEKQLKHIMSKWRIRKKVSSTDMENMLTVKRKREEDGKPTEFMYHGHVVAEAKLRRAEKRCKIPTLSNDMLPAYIEVFSPNTEHQSPLPSPIQSQSIAQNSGIDHIFPKSTHRGLSWNALSEESSILRAGQWDSSFAPNEPVLGTFCPPNGDYLLCGNPEFSQTDYPEGMIARHSPASFTPKTHYDFDFSLPLEPMGDHFEPIIDLSPFCTSPMFANSPGRPVLWPRLPTPVPNSNIASPLSTSVDLNPVALSHDCQIPPGHDLDPISLSNRVIFYGANPESIIPSVQMLKKLLHHLQDDMFRNQHMISCGKLELGLHDKIRNKNFLSKVDDVALWAYETSAKMVRQQKGDRQSSCIDIQPFSERSGKHNRQMSQAQAQSQSTSNNGNPANSNGTPISYCDIWTGCTTGGVLRIQLHRTSKEISDRDDDGSAHTLSICVIPEIRNCAGTGIFITVPAILPRSQHLPIYTSIRTFNVVPQDSDIISLVRENDVEGVKNLIEDKKASARDVDPRGISLLWYAMYSGCSETFRLLLNEGASTDQCLSCTNTCNIIDSIWNEYIELVLGHYNAGIPFPTKNITDLGQCRSMTELALAKGCLPGESVPFNLILPTPIFRLMIQYRRVTRNQLADSLRELLHVGYDKEVQNDTGRTPLLHSAFELRPGSLTVMELLLTEGANIHAIDYEGRGALHLCFWISSSLEESYHYVCRGSNSAYNDPCIIEHLETAHNSGNGVPDSEDNGSTMQGFLPPEDIDSQPGEYIDLETVDLDSGDSDMEFTSCDSEVLSDVSDDGPWRPQSCYWCHGGDWIQDWCGEEDPAHGLYCEDRDVDDFDMPEAPDEEPQPWMCRARIRLKALALLNAGCCPNSLDSKGLSPSDYARAEGLWPQWEWALSKSGFLYNGDTNSWVREEC